MRCLTKTLLHNQSRKKCPIPTNPHQGAMRRAGSNPTDIEVADMVNRVGVELENSSGNINFQVLRVFSCIFNVF